jgi:hypothetical protein
MSDYDSRNAAAVNTIEFHRPFRSRWLMDRATSTAAARSTRQSIMSYLDGEQTLDWILNVIACGGDRDSLRQFVLDLTGYGDPQRHKQLLARLDAA